MVLKVLFNIVHFEPRILKDVVEISCNSRTSKAYIKKETYGQVHCSQYIYDLRKNYGENMQPVSMPVET